MLCYSLVYDGREEQIERLRQLPKLPLELVVPLDALRTLSLIELIDPIIDERAEVVAVKLHDTAGDYTGDDVEKAVVAADELGAEYVVPPVGGGEATAALEALESALPLAVAYSKKLVLEPSFEVVESAVEFTNRFIGGLFKLSLSPVYPATTEEFLKLAVNHLGLLAAVKLVSYTEKSRVSRVSSPYRLNAFTVIRELVSRGYDSLFVIDYEARGLLLPPSAVRDDCNLVLQYIRSTLEELA